MKTIAALFALSLFATPLLAHAESSSTPAASVQQASQKGDALAKKGKKKKPHTELAKKGKKKKPHAGDELAKKGKKKKPHAGEEFAKKGKKKKPHAALA